MSEGPSAVRPDAVTCGGGGGRSPTATRSRRRDRVAVESPPPNTMWQPLCPPNLYPVGCLIERPQETVGSYSRATRLILQLDTWMTDLHRVSNWYLALNVDDTEATRREPLLLGLTPISVLTHRPVQVAVSATNSNNSNGDYNDRTIRMDLEARTRMTVRAVPQTIYGTPPRWFRDDLSRTANAAVLELRQGGSVQVADEDMLSVDFQRLRWSQGLVNRVDADALIYIARDDVFGVNGRPRSWMTQERT